jgi:hypothetical protein
MATFVGIKLNISGDEYSSTNTYNSTEIYNSAKDTPLATLLSSLKIGSFNAFTYPAPIVYNFVVYSKAIKLEATDFIDVTAIKRGFYMPAATFGNYGVYVGIKVAMSDFLDLANLKNGVVMEGGVKNFQPVGVRVVFNNFSLGYGGVDLF